MKSNQPMFVSTWFQGFPSCFFKNFALEHDLVAPVTIKAASIWIFSKSFFSYWVQLSLTTSAYSNIGLINVKYIVWSVFLSNWNLSIRRRFTLFHALKAISCTCSCQEHDLFKINPKCLWLSTFLIWVLSIYKGGWAGGTVFREIISSSVLLGLKLTNHCFDHSCILFKSAFIKLAAVSGLSTIKYSEVSSAKRRMLEPTSLTMSFMYIRNNSGPSIEIANNKLPRHCSKCQHSPERVPSVWWHYQQKYLFSSAGIHKA